MAKNIFSFSSINRERKEYVKLESLFNHDGEGTEYQIKNAWINTKSAFNPESAVVEIGMYNVNIPQHQLYEVKKILASEEALAAIEEGRAGFVIREYDKELTTGKKKVVKKCYAAEWIDVDPEDFMDYEDEDNEEETEDDD